MQLIYNSDRYYLDYVEGDEPELMTHEVFHAVSAGLANHVNKPLLNRLRFATIQELEDAQHNSRY